MNEFNYINLYILLLGTLFYLYDKYLEYARG